VQPEWHEARLPRYVSESMRFGSDALRPRVSALIAGLLTTHAATSAAAPGEPRALSRTDLGSLGLETAVSATLLIGSRVLLDAPTRCTACGTNELDLGVRDALRLEEPGALPALSHVTSLAILPLGGFLALFVPAAEADRLEFAGQDAWLMLNGFLLTSAFTDATKKLVGRERPAFWAGNGDETEFADTPSARYRSFFSGDTAWAFNFAATATTLAYLRGYEIAPYLAGGSAAFATSVAYIRVAADLHWTTDVLAGAAVGTGIGVLVPLLGHPRALEQRSLSLAPLPIPGGAGLALRWIQ